jgi:lipopolysaccharide transport system ATP-binding protein
MSDVAISVENLSKSYTISHEHRGRSRYKTLREDLAEMPKRFWSRLGRNGQSSSETFWALKDISFEIKQGEVVGIIGRNGAGKSTLLKILSRITEPTSGQAKIYGRVGSLLEVGTGFHPELTGRENIFLNGAILGMSRAEIRARFDEIVAFAEIEKFLDTPVKRYSSGMYVRLAFAVAAHLEPEILVIDEVLAVGDAVFQKKCLGKMGEVALSGRTVLFVSHNMQAIQRLCQRAVLLSHGGIAYQGETKEAVTLYLSKELPGAVNVTSLKERRDRSGNGEIRLTSFKIENSAGQTLESVQSGEDVVFVFGYECLGTRVSNVDIGFSFDTEFRESLFGFYSSYVGKTFDSLPVVGSFRCHVQKLPIAPGRYWVAARILVGGEEADFPHEGIALVDVQAGNFYGTGHEGFRGKTYLMISGEWSISTQADPATHASPSGNAMSLTIDPEENRHAN